MPEKLDVEDAVVVEARLVAIDGASLLERLLELRTDFAAEICVRSA